MLFCISSCFVSICVLCFFASSTSAEITNSDSGIPYTISTIHESEKLPFDFKADKSRSITFQATPGLYQFSNIIDAREYNWDSMYFELNRFQNKGQITGPWFIQLEGALPLVPAWWVYLDDKKLGIWISQRVSIEDIENKRFRGAMSFYIETLGEHVLKFVPYKDDYKMRWISAKLEVDPEDRILDELPKMSNTSEALLFADWDKPEYWEKQKKLLETTHSLYQQPLERVYNHFSKIQEDSYLDGHIVPLIVAEKLGGREGSIEKALEVVDYYLELSSWGGQQEASYNYNGDKMASSVFYHIAMAYHMLTEEELGVERRKKILDKLRYQGKEFFKMALLGRDGWGGSIVQDHGWRAMFAFGAGALYMVDDIPDAQLWVRYIIPRLERCINVMPRDGVISPASYMTPCLYLHELMHYREALLALTGIDILEQGPFAKIPDFFEKIMRKDDAAIFAGPHAMRTWNGGGMFLNRIAQKYGDCHAAWIQERFAKIPEAKCAHAAYADGHFRGILWSFFTYDSTIKSAEPEYKDQVFAYFNDTGLVYYRNDNTDVTFSVQCGTWPSAYAYQQLTCASDRLKLWPIDGHFLLFLGQTPMLIMAEGGYKPYTYIGNCMLVDNEGQYGSIGYPCSISNWTYRGEHIEKVHWDGKNGTGFIRLNLRTSYPESMGLACYTRDFIITPEKKFICRDSVVFNEPHTLSWLFHNKRSAKMRLDENLCCTIGIEKKLYITPNGPDIPLTAHIEETPVVWAYYSQSNWEPYDQVEYKTTKKVSSAVIDFELTW